MAKYYLKKNRLLITSKPEGSVAIFDDELLKISKPDGLIRGIWENDNWRTITLLKRELKKVFSVNPINK